MSPTAEAVLVEFQKRATARIATDLASLLQRALEHGICVVADVDIDEGTSYSIEGQYADSGVEYDQAIGEWKVVSDGE